MGSPKIDLPDIQLKQARRKPQYKIVYKNCSKPTKKAARNERLY